MKIENLKLKIRKQVLIIILATLLAFITSGLLLRMGKQPKQQRKDLTFTRQLIGQNQYVGEIGGVMKTAFAKDKDNGKVTVTRGDNRLEFDLPINNPSLTSEDVGLFQSSDISFTSPDKIIEAKYNLIPNGLKEEIILNKIPQENRLPMKLKTENLKLKITPDGIPVFYDDKSEYQFHFERPFMKDGAGNISYGVNYIFKGQNNLFQKRSGTNTKKTLLGTNVMVSPTNHDIQMAIELDSSWLHDPKRILPITIDPTVVHDTSAKFVTGQFNRTSDTGSGASPNLTTNYQQLPADQYTAGLWHMNETINGTCSGSTDVCDSSGNVNDGMINGTTINTTTQLLGGAARNFASGDYITHPVTNFNPSAKTIEMWVKPSWNWDDGVIHGLWQNNNNANINQANWVTIFKYSTNNLYFRVVNSSSVLQDCVVAATGFFNSGQWTHVAAAYDSSGERLYINGSLVCQSGTITVPSANLDTTARIGFGHTGSFGAGIIDEVRISNIARSAEEIKLDAQRRPYSIYTSDVVDLFNVSAWTSFTWTELGVATGDGETLSSSTNLISQWNFNATTSTATATSDAGSCGSTCNGTLTNFANTTGQDALAASGWTATNKRWGAGALMFDGTNDTVSMGTESNYDFERTNSFSIEAWIKTNSAVAEVIFSKLDSSGPFSGYELRLNTSNKIDFVLNNTVTTNQISVSATNIVNDGNWHYLTVTYNGSSLASGVNLYIDGVSQALTVNVNNLTASTLNNITPYIGSRNNINTFFTGVIDSTRIYSRVLTASEILSNYNAGNVELQTRVGNSTDPNDGTWEAWRPTTSETQVDSMDGPYQYNTTDSGLVSYWPMDETTGTNVSDVKDSNIGTATGTTITDGKFGKSRVFGSVSTDKIDGGTSSNLDNIAAYSICAWIKPTSITSNNRIYFKGTGSATDSYDSLYINASTALRMSAGYNTQNVDVTGDTTLVSLNQWQFVCGTWTGGTAGSSIKLYLNGVESTSYTTNLTGSGSRANSGSVIIGNRSAQDRVFFGNIDEVRVFNSALSASTIYQYYIEGSTNANLLRPSTDTIAKLEGSGSERIQTGAPAVDANTVALWHFEETGGSGAYVKDSSPYAANATPAGGTSSSQGIVGRSYNFNGATNAYMAYVPGTQFNVPTNGNFSGESWIKTNNNGVVIWRVQSGTPLIYMEVGPTTAGGTNNKFVVYLRDDGNTLGVFSSNTTVNDGKWHHVAFTATTSGSNRIVNLYVDGILDSTGTWPTAGTMTLTSAGDYISVPSASAFNGNIDEIRISNIARSADEIAEAYRAGRDHRIGKTIASTDLSAKQKLPFYVAADRPGTYLETMIGNNAYDNYEPDTNTVGLWHLDENNQSNTLPVTSGLSLWVKADSITGLADGAAVSSWADLSGNGRNMAQATGSKQPVYKVNIVNGLPIVRFTAATFQQLTNATNFASPISVFYVGKQTGGANGRVLTSVTNNWLLGFWSGARNQGYFDGWVTPSGSPATDTNWHVFSAVETGSLSSVYGDGTLVASNGNGVTGPNGLAIGCFGVSSECSNTDVAEVIIYNGALSDSDRGKIESYLNSKYAINGASTQTNYVKDSSGYGSNGTPYGSTISVQGKIGKASNFNGRSDYISILDSPNWTFGTGDLTVDFWVNFNVLPANGLQQDLVSQWAAGNVGWGEEIENGIGGNPSGTYSLRFFNSNGMDFRRTVPVATKTWYHLAFVRSGNNHMIFLNGLQQGATEVNAAAFPDSTEKLAIGVLTASSPGRYLNGTIDEVRISKGIARSADDIRAAFEYGKRSHEVTIDFAANLLPGDLITNSSDKSFMIDSTAYGSNYRAGNLYLGDKIIVRENYNGTEYIAQGTVNSIALIGGTVTVSSWDGGSTFPASGFTSNASVFKWQREYFDLGGSLSTQRNAATRLTLRLTNGNEGRTIWLDDFESAGNYLTTPGGSTITSSTGDRYFQYRVVQSSNDTPVSSSITTVSVNYTTPVATLDLPVNSATNQALNTVLKTTMTNTFANYLRYKIDICTDSGMTLNCQTFDQTSSQTGWSGQNSQSSTAYTSGTQAVYTIQTPLTAAATFYWRSYAIDPSGTDGWSSTQGSPNSFTTSTVPATPTLDLPANSATNQSVATVLKTTDTDANSDYLRYKINICTDSGMTLNCQTFDQTSSQTGWSGQNTQGNTAYTSGTQATYTIQTPLSGSTVYYWKSYAKDPGGSAVWSNTQGSPNSYTTTGAPTAPTTPWAQGSANPTNVPTLTPTFSAIHNDPDADAAVFYQVQVNTANDFSGTTMWDSGQTSMSSTANGARSPNATYAGLSLSWASTYYWRIRFTDNKAAVGAWSATQNFTTSTIPAIPSLDLPANQATNQIFSPVFKTTGTDANADYLRYKIQMCSDPAMTINCQQFDQTFSQTGWSGQNTQGNTAYTSGTQATYTVQTTLNYGTTYYWRSYAIDPGGSNNWSSTQSTAFYFTTGSPPGAPTSLLTNGSTNPTGLFQATPPYFSAIHNDPSYPANNYQVQVNTDPTFGGTAMWDSSQQSMTTTTNGNRSPNISYAGSTLDLRGRTYYWRIRFWDTAGYGGTWSAAANFTMTNLGQAASCKLQEGPQNNQIIISWIDQSSIETGYYIEKNTDAGGFGSLTTRPANNTSYTDSAVSSNHTYQYRIRAISGSDYSQWCTTDTLNLGSGSFQLNGLKLNGIKLD